MPVNEKERLAAIRREPEVESVEPTDWEELVPELKAGSGKPRRAGQILKALAGSKFVKGDPELRRIFKENEALCDFIGHEDETEAALDQMKPHHKEFERLLEDTRALMDRTSELFGEESFAPLRFTAEDVQRAFENVGFPSSSAPDEEQRGVYIKAILFVATKERREHLWRELLMRLPAYVKQGRFLEAHLIDFAAQVTGEELSEPNPFLLQMFYHGLQEWADRQQRDQAAFLKEMGVDPKSMTLEEMEAWVANATADPSKTARLDQFLAAHPAIRRATTDSPDELHRTAIRLLDRPGAARRLLPGEETGPWMSLLVEKFRLMMEKYNPQQTEEPLPKPTQEAAFTEHVLPAIREMAKGIFTPERIRKLVADLEDYRKELFDGGNKQEVLWAVAAVRYVEPEQEPERNAFLLNLCYRAMLPPSEETAAADAGLK